MWRPDGWGWRAKIGLLVPHADMCREAEVMAMAPAGVSIHATRVPFLGVGKGGTMAPSIGPNPLSAYLEEDLKRPVLTANQVLFWYALKRTGSGARVCLAMATFSMSNCQPTCSAERSGR
jgi:maleate cis-trans isomerase